jgi:ATP-dependent Clp protease ATP-binding subunit ClpC
MLGGGIGKDDHANARWDEKAERLSFERKEQPEAEAEVGTEKPNEAKTAEEPQSDTGKTGRRRSRRAGKYDVEVAI